MTPTEREIVTHVLDALLDSCLREYGDLRPSSNDYAEAHGIARTLKDLNFELAETLWHQRQKAAIARHAEVPNAE